MKENEYRKYFEKLLREEGDTVVARPDVSEEEMDEKDVAQLRLHLLTAALTKYKGLIFEPDETEQRPEDLEEKADNIMAMIAERREDQESDNNGPDAGEKKTNDEINRDRTSEPSPPEDGGKKIINFSTLHTVITAAAAAAVLIIVAWLAIDRPVEPEVTAARVQVAYLLDIRGEIRLSRPDAEEKILRPDAGSELLYSQDEVFIPEGSQATVMFPGRAYNLTENDHFRVLADTVEREEDGRWYAQKPSISVFSEHDAIVTLNEEQIVKAPERMFAAVTPRKLRWFLAVKPRVTILSPRGRTLSDAPYFIWRDSTEEEAEEKPVYEVSVILLDEMGEPEAASSWYETEQREFTWDDTGWPDARRGREYIVHIRRNEELLTDGRDTFRIMGKKEADNFKRRLDAIRETLPEGQSRLFLKANLLMSEKWRCYAEARIKAAELVDSYPEDVTYLKLLQHCYQALEMPENVREVQKRLDKITN